MRICFYLDNDRLKGKDFSNPFGGNPGIGGTQYMIWTISYYLKLTYPDIDVIVLTNYKDTMPHDMKCVECSDVYDSIIKAKKLKADVFIVRGPYADQRVYSLIDEKGLNTVMWSHNFESVKGLDYAADCKYVKRIVCVGKQQYHRLRDHRIFSKATYIYNALDFDIYDKYSNNKKYENIICFMGAIDRNKGIHNIAQIWSSIERKIPNVKLYVIGSGVLYGDNKQMGKFNIAEKTYEEEFISYFLDSEGKIKNNIKFFGILNGEEKIRVMSKAKVGICNTTSFRETFCISAIEFEALGVPVVSFKKDGFLDTVINKSTGILIKNNNELANAICKIMNEKNVQEELSDNAKKFVRSEFNIYNICTKWVKLFQEIVNNEEASVDIHMDNMLNDYKLFREINRRLKKIYIFKNNPSLIELDNKFREYKYKVKRIIKNERAYGEG